MDSVKECFQRWSQKSIGRQCWKTCSKPTLPCNSHWMGSSSICPSVGWVSSEGMLCSQFACWRCRDYERNPSRSKQWETHWNEKWNVLRKTGKQLTNLTLSREVLWLQRVFRAEVMGSSGCLSCSISHTGKGKQSWRKSRGTSGLRVHEQLLPWQFWIMWLSFPGIVIFYYSFPTPNMKVGFAEHPQHNKRDYIWC